MVGGGCGADDGGWWWLILAVELLPLPCSAIMPEGEREEESVCVGFLCETTSGMLRRCFGLNMPTEVLVKKWLFTNQN